jgi:hypothetical protein
MVTHYPVYNNVFHSATCLWCNSFICSNHLAQNHILFTDKVKSLQNGSWFKWKYTFIEKILHGKHTVIISVKLLK